ncbi:MAG: Gfo/Idh/MocA family oxidoreductase [Clostridiales bacterium]|nr:Gfo/Idh/MocA family oxidoreductase [Clostridiales bacterium]
MKTLSIIGLGNRGTEYMRIAKTLCSRLVKINAICDISPQAIEDFAPIYKIRKENCFYSTDEFFARGKISDAVFICTQDRSHYEIGKRAIELGYDILMEKPVSDSISECIELRDLAEKHKVKLVVCHVLRYSNYYRKIKQAIRDGLIGKPLMINHTENVGYFHFAHSYVRGNWRSSETSTPSLLAKCCHDLDLIQWFADSECVSVSSYGSLSAFTSENAPEGAADRCVDCKVKNCPYNAVNLYIKDPFWKAKFIKYMTRTLTGKRGAGKKLVKKAIYEGDYGRCVYKCDNNVCDHQVIAMQFENGLTATHTLNAFSDKMMRESHITGTKGELIGYDKKLKLNIFGGKKKTLSRLGALPGHVEADIRTVIAFCKLINGELDDKVLSDVTFISDTIASHQIVMAAEKSRLNGGIPVDPRTIL